MTQKKVLGRGLGAFFPEYSEKPTDSDSATNSMNTSASEMVQSTHSGTAKSARNKTTPARFVNPKSSSENMTKNAVTTQSEGPLGAPKMNPDEKASRILDVPVQDIRPNPYQPRTEFEPEALQELADSIQMYGLIQPVTVRYIGEKRFELISGERRLRASKLAGLAEIPAYIREANDEQLIALALVENIQREQLNAL